MAKQPIAKNLVKSGNPNGKTVIPKVIPLAASTIPPVFKGGNKGKGKK